MILTMIRLMLLKWISRLEYYKLPQYCGLKDRRQFLGFLFTSFAELLFIPGNLLGLNDYLQPHTFDVLNYIQLVFFVVLQLAFWRNWISITTALYILFIEVVMKISVESLWQAYMGGQSHVLGNFNIILMIAVVALAVRLFRLALILVMILTFDLAACFHFYDFGYMLRVCRVFFVGYLLIFFVLTYNSKTVGRGLRQPRKVKEDEVKALEMLSNLTDNEHEKAASLLDRLTPRSKEKLRKKLTIYFRDSELETLVYTRLCPELTKNEIEICGYVLQGKSVKEICELTGKTESNITSQRSHIRSKLKMKRQEDLRSGLEIRILEVRQMLEKEQSS